MCVWLVVSVEEKAVLNCAVPAVQSVCRPENKAICYPLGLCRGASSALFLFAVYARVAGERDCVCNFTCDVLCVCSTTLP